MEEHCNCPSLVMITDMEQLKDAMALAVAGCEVHSKDLRGIDSDLEYCLFDNPQDFDLDGIKKVLAVFEGAREGPDWHWIIELKDGDIVHFTGGCDYSGWGCVSHASGTRYPTTFNALIDIHNERIRNDLIDQVMDGMKQRTWEERMSLIMPTIL